MDIEAKSAEIRSAVLRVYGRSKRAGEGLSFEVLANLISSWSQYNPGEEESDATMLLRSVLKKLFEMKANPGHVVLFALRRILMWKSPEIVLRYFES